MANEPLSFLLRGEHDARTACKGATPDLVWLRLFRHFLVHRGELLRAVRSLPEEYGHIVAPLSHVSELCARMMLFQYRTAGLNRGDNSVGDPAGSHLREKVTYDFVPGAVRDHRMDAAISNHFDVALAD